MSAAPALPAAAGAVEPSAACDGELTAAQERSWRERGFALVDGLLPAELVAATRDDAAGRFPAAGSPEAEGLTDFGSAGRMTFPSGSEAMNALTLHPRLLRAVARLLGVETTRVRLTQSDVWPKYGRRRREGGDRDNDDQRIHVDYPNHTLTHPPPWDAPEAVEAILYLSDVDACDGATRLVPRSGPDDPAYAWPVDRTPGVGALPWINDRSRAEAWLAEHAPEVAAWRAEHLYPREVEARYRVGSLLLYRHDTWHRGTPLRPGARRLAQNLTFRTAGSEWISTLHVGWAWSMYRPSQRTERLVARASVEQRCALGFPEPGHPYWTRETVAAVEARYGPLGFDAGPYRPADARSDPCPSTRS